MRITAAALSLCFIVVVVAAIPLAPQDEKKMLPSEAMAGLGMQAVARARKDNTNYMEARPRVARELLDQVRTEGISSVEKVYYGDLLAAAGKTDEARSLYLKFMDGQDTTAQLANARYLDLLARQGEFEAAEEGIKEYYRRFRPNPEILGNLGEAANLLAKKYEKEGRYADAIAVMTAEINFVDTSAPYTSCMMLRFHEQAFREEGRYEEWRELMLKTANDYLAMFEQRKANAEKMKDERYREMTEQYEGIADFLLQPLTEIADFIGKEAPPFTFTHFYNTGPFDLGDLRGSVVLLDFWANWCAPCKKAIPDLRKVYGQFREKGFEIVSVTSIQEYFVDGDIDEYDISEQRELELTEQLIKNYNMTWRVAFSENSVADRRYGVTGIPTLVLVDRSGVIRYMHVGVEDNLADVLAEQITELLTEK